MRILNFMLINIKIKQTHTYKVVILNGNYTEIFCSPDQTKTASNTKLILLPTCTDYFKYVRLS